MMLNFFYLCCYSLAIIQLHYQPSDAYGFWPFGFGERVISPFQGIKGYGIYTGDLSALPSSPTGVLTEYFSPDSDPTNNQNESYDQLDQESEQNQTKPLGKLSRFRVRKPSSASAALPPRYFGFVNSPQFPVLQAPTVLTGSGSGESPSSQSQPQFGSFKSSFPWNWIFVGPDSGQQQQQQHPQPQFGEQQQPHPYSQSGYHPGGAPNSQTQYGIFSNKQSLLNSPNQKQIHRQPQPQQPLSQQQFSQQQRRPPNFSGTFSTNGQHQQFQDSQFQGKQQFVQQSDKVLAKDPINQFQPHQQIQQQQTQSGQVQKQQQQFQQSTLSNGPVKVQDSSSSSGTQSFSTPTQYGSNTFEQTSFQPQSGPSSTSTRQYAIVSNNSPSTISSSSNSPSQQLSVLKQQLPIPISSSSSFPSSSFPPFPQYPSSPYFSSSFPSYYQFPNQQHPANSDYFQSNSVNIPNNQRPSSVDQHHKTSFSSNEEEGYESAPVPTFVNTGNQSQQILKRAETTFSADDKPSHKQVTSPVDLNQAPTSNSGEQSKNSHLVSDQISSAISKMVNNSGANPPTTVDGSSLIN